MDTALWLQLQKVILSVLVECVTDAGNFRIFESDHGSDGLYTRFAGVQAACEMLCGEHDKKPPHPAVLIVGISPLLIKRSCNHSSGEASLRALLGWPGAAFMQYGFNKEDLCFAVSRILEGAKEPLPRELLPTLDDILRLTSDIRHWLTNRLNNTNSTLANFRAAANGDVTLHPSHLEPVEAISRQHRKPLDRLWGFDLYIRNMTSSVSGVHPVKESVAQFESYWLALEVARQRYRTKRFEHEADRALAYAVIQELEKVHAAINEVIAAMRLLDDGIKTAFKRGKVI